MPEYRVELDVFHGPMDLLLYLVRKHEVEVTDVSISSITEQYLEYVERIRQLEPETAGEFLVLAATLMEIKSRALLPRITEDGEIVEHRDAAEELADPRSTLIQQLLEYKQFKDRAAALDEQFEAAQRRFPRLPAELNQATNRYKEYDLGEIGVWELFSAFERVMSEVRTPREHEVVADDTPISVHAERIRTRLAADGPTAFEAFFEGMDRKTEIIGVFLAVLEMAKEGELLVLLEIDEAGVKQLRLALREQLPQDEDDAALHSAEPEPAPRPQRSAKWQAIRDKLESGESEDEPDESIIDATDEFDEVLREVDAVMNAFRLHPPKPGEDAANDGEGGRSPAEDAEGAAIGQGAEPTVVG